MMTDDEIGTGTSGPRILAGIGLGTNVAAGPADAVASIAPDGMRLARPAALSAGTVTLLPSRGIDTVDEPAAASPLRAPARPRRTTAVRVRVRMNALSFPVSSRSR